MLGFFLLGRDLFNPLSMCAQLPFSNSKRARPICGSDLVRIRYLGVFSELAVSRRGEIVRMFGDEGKPLWEVVVERRFKGG